MATHPLFRAWSLLIALSLATTSLSVKAAKGGNSHLIVAGVLIIAGLKARIILQRYLGIAASRFWTKAFDAVGAAFLLLAFTIYLIGGSS